VSERPGARSLRGRTGDALRELDLRPRRHLGQSFLVDARIAERIVNEAGVVGESVLEIGPGLGALTDLLAERASRLALVEIDRSLADRLQSRFAGSARVHVVHADALTVDFDACSLGSGRAVVVANLPYRVGSQILLRLFDERRRFSRLVLMLQREVAARLTASPATRDYGLLSLWTALYAEARAVFRVSPAAFVPRPKVESAVVSLRLLDEPRVPAAQIERLRVIARAAFSQRRKTLRRALAGTVAAAAFERAGIDPQRRGETLSLEEFARLAAASGSAGG